MRLRLNPLSKFLDPPLARDDSGELTAINNEDVMVSRFALNYKVFIQVLSYVMAVATTPLRRLTTHKLYHHFYCNGNGTEDILYGFCLLLYWVQVPFDL